MRALLVRYVKFLGTSLVGTVVEIFVLWLLSDYVFGSGYWQQYVISPVIAFEVSVIVNYMVSYFYVWRDRREKGASKGRFVRLLLTYNMSNALVFLLRLGGILLVERFFSLDVVYCNLIAMCFSGMFNFIISNFLIFRGKSRQAQK